MSIYDADGEVVFRETTGARLPGTTDLNWSGFNVKGEMAPSGNYTMSCEYHSQWQAGNSTGYNLCKS